MIRILSETKDIDFLREAWEFESSAPQWFRDTNNAFKESFAEFLNKAGEELLIGIEERDAKALLRICIGTINQLHLYVRRGSNAQTLLDAFESVKVYLRGNGITNFAGWIPKRNKPVIAIYKALGFIHKGARCFQGKYERKTKIVPIEWILFEGKFS